MTWHTLPVVSGFPTTRASVGYDERAAVLQELIRDSHLYLTEGLGTDFEPELVVVDRADWSLGGDATPPYGIPYASELGFELVIPADPRENLLVDAYAEFEERSAVAEV